MNDNRNLPTEEPIYRFMRFQKEHFVKFPINFLFKNMLLNAI